MPTPADASPAFVLFLSEPAAGSRRAVQVRGLPFTVGSSPESSVRLRADGSSLVRIEQGPKGLRAVDLTGDCLHCDGLLAADLPLYHGSSFEVGDASIRFLVGTRESLRPRRERQKAVPSCAAAEHLRRLDDLQARIGELRRGLGRRPRKAMSAAR